MKARALAALVLAAHCVLAGEKDHILRVSIPDLLNPAKRMAGLQAYVLRTEPDSAKNFEWDDLHKFAASHAGFQVQQIAAAVPGGARVVVTFNRVPYGSDDLSAWPPESVARAFASRRGDLLVPYPIVYYYRFAADGLALGGPGPEMCFHANVGDFNHDGSVDLVEYTGDNGLSGGTAFTREGMNVSYAVIRPAGNDTKPVFAVLYDTHPGDRVEVAPWGGQLFDEDRDGVFEFQIGPRSDGEIKPKVTFRWDAARGTWVGQEPAEHAHYRLLDLADVAAEVRRIVQSGGLDYAREFKPKEEADAERVETPDGIVESLKPDEASRPYRYASLAALKDEQILEWMVRRRTVWDVAWERMDAAADVPGLWKMDPKTAALAYLLSHRPPSARSNFRYAFDDFDALAAPTAGTVAISDAPSGCFAPAGAFVHFLHCEPGDSFLAFAGSLGRSEAGPLDQQKAFDFYKVRLSDAEARQVLRIVWWLSRVRAQRIGGESGARAMSSIGDAQGTVDVRVGNEHVRMEGPRFGGFRGAYVAVNDFSEDYDKTAFLNLVIYFFQHDLVTHLGKRWPKSDLEVRALGWPQRDLNPPAGREQVARLSAEWLEMFLRRSLPHAVAGVALDAAGDLGLKELRTKVARMRNILPPPSKSERQLKELDAAMEVWKKMHGERGTNFGEIERRNNARKVTEGPANDRSMPPLSGLEPSAPSIAGSDVAAPTEPAPAIPGSEPVSKKPDDATPAPAAAPGPALKEILSHFAKFDVLFAKRESISEKQSPGEKETAALRESIALTLRKLDTWDDARSLERWALEGEMGIYHSGTRLAQVDRKRALGVLRHYAASSPDESDRDHYQTLLDAEPEIAPVHTATRLARQAELSRADVGSLLEVLADANSSFQDRGTALRTLVPLGTPGKYPFPEIDSALLGDDILKGDGYGFLEEFARDLALRLGPKSWNRLVELSALKDSGGIPEFPFVVPGMAIVAQREPARFREALAHLIEPQLAETNGELGKMFWCAWQADLRNLKPALERVGTSSADDAEGQWMTMSSNQASPVKDRYHLPRQIVSIWNEEDPLTRAKLLVAFGTAYPGKVMDLGAEPMRGHLQAVASLLDAQQHAAILAFLERCAETSSKIESVSPYWYSSNQPDPKSAFRELVRAAFDQH